MSRKTISLVAAVRQVLGVQNRQSADFAIRRPRISNGRFSAAEINRNTPALVIFDKDGTLLCFHTMWIPWALQTTQRIEKTCGFSISKEISAVLGLCPIENKVKPGLLAEGTMSQITNEIAGVLTLNGVPSFEARQVVVDCMKTSNEKASAPNHVKELYDTFALFSRLKQYDTKIAVCTADNRKSTEQALERMEVRHLVDMLVCGDDSNTMPKPHPHNALRICNQLGIQPSETIMVGDTRVDIEMAHNAGLGAAVGVLSGVGCENHLHQADYLINHIGDLIDVFFDKNGE